MKKFISIIVFLFSCYYLQSQSLGLQQINVGASANDHTGDPLRTVGIKTNANMVIINDSVRARYTKTQVNNLINAIEFNASSPTFTGTTTTQGLTATDTVTLPYNKIKIGNYPVINITAQNLNTLQGAWQNIQQVLNIKAPANNSPLTGATLAEQLTVGKYSSNTKLPIDSINQRAGQYYGLYKGATQMTPDIPANKRIQITDVPGLIHIGDTTDVTPYKSRIVYKTSDDHFYGCTSTIATKKWKRLDN
jgi:hypothetical protein